MARCPRCISLLSHIHQKRAANDKAPRIKEADALGASWGQHARKLGHSHAHRVVRNNIQPASQSQKPVSIRSAGVFRPRADLKLRHADIEPNLLPKAEINLKPRASICRLRRSFAIPTADPLCDSQARRPLTSAVGVIKMKYILVCPVHDDNASSSFSRQVQPHQAAARLATNSIAIPEVDPSIHHTRPRLGNTER